MNKLFRELPEAVVDILTDVLDVGLPAMGPVRLESNDFNDRPSRDFQPDTVITLGPPHKPVHGIVVEVQQEKTDAKRRQLPRYAAALWLMLRCPVTVLCVCMDADAAAWYTKSIATELPGYVFRPTVLGPNEIPRITDSDTAAKWPALAALGVVAHGRDRQVLTAFVAAALELKLKDGDSPSYYDYAYTMAAPAVRRVLEEIMAATPWLIRGPYATENFDRGKAEGRTEGRADAVLRVLDARKIEVTEEARARIHACTDLEQLDTWLERAISAGSVAELFD